MAHYVYYSYEEWGRGYLGSRSTKKTIEEDQNYLGSFRDKTFNPTGKIVLMEFETGKEARDAEVTLHDLFDVAVNPHFANKAKQTSSGFSTEGTVGPWAGLERSPEDRARMKKKGKRSSRGMLGKKRPPETIQKWKETMATRDNTEMRQKLKESALKQWANPEAREKILSGQEIARGKNK